MKLANRSPIFWRSLPAGAGAAAAASAASRRMSPTSASASEHQVDETARWSTGRPGSRRSRATAVDVAEQVVLRPDAVVDVLEHRRRLTAA